MGGRSLTWGGITLRLSDREFAQGWPIRHSDLDPHYSALERQFAVWGQRDGLTLLPDGEYQPPAPLTPGEQLARSCRQRSAVHPRGGFRGIAPRAMVLGPVSVPRAVP